MLFSCSCIYYHRLQQHLQRAHPQAARSRRRRGALQDAPLCYVTLYVIYICYVISYYVVWYVTSCFIIIILHYIIDCIVLHVCCDPAGRFMSPAMRRAPGPPGGPTAGAAEDGGDQYHIM